MGIGNTKQENEVQAIAEIPASAARDYIADMLAELCAVAEQSGQRDLHILLKLTTQAARNFAE